VIPIKDNIPTDRVPFVTIALIAICVAVFIWQHPTGFGSVDDGKVIRYGAIPYEVTHPGKDCGAGNAVTANGRLIIDPNGGPAKMKCEGQTVETVGGEAKIRHVPGPHESPWLTILIAMFMHGGFLHIAGNMLFLWIFGNNVEDSMGRGRFVLFYLLGGLAAFIGQTAVDTGSATPTIGASGAIAAVLGGYLLLYPRARVITLIFIIFFFTIVELPAILVLGFWFVQQILFGAADLTTPTGDGGGVAYFAHIGGFVFGLALIRAFAQRHKSVPPRFPVY
jgi:membrane associated rhomboid family serine protease